MPTFARHRAMPTLVVALASVLLLASTAARAQEPVLVVPSGADDGELRVAPEMARVEPGARATLVLTNGGPDATLRLRVVDVVVDEGVQRVGDRREDVRVPSDEITLATGDAARVPVIVDRAARPGVVSVQATVDGVAPPVVVASTIVVGTSGAPAVEVQRASESAMDVTLTTPTPDVLDLTVRVRAWPGTEGTTLTHRGIVVGPGPRTVSVDVPGLALGRVTVDVAAAPFDAVDPATSVATSLAFWHAPAAILVAVVGVVFAVAGLLLLRRSRRRAVLGA